MVETDSEIEKSVKPQTEKAAGLMVESPEEPLFYFCFVCRGSKAAYKEIEKYIKGKTTTRVIFQRFSNNYLSVSEVQLKPVDIRKMKFNHNFTRGPTK